MASVQMQSSSSFQDGIGVAGHDCTVQYLHGCAPPALGPQPGFYICAVACPQSVTSGSFRESSFSFPFALLLLATLSCCHAQSYAAPTCAACGSWIGPSDGLQASTAGHLQWCLLRCLLDCYCCSGGVHRSGGIQHDSASATCSPESTYKHHDRHCSYFWRVASRVCSAERGLLRLQYRDVRR